MAYTIIMITSILCLLSAFTPLVAYMYKRKKEKQIKNS